MSSARVRTADPHPGAESVDAVLSTLLGRGFALLSSYRPADLVALPVLHDWSAVLHAAAGGRAELEVGAPGEVFYRGDLGGSPPAGWHAALSRRRLLVVLVCSGVDLSGPDRTARIRAAQASGWCVAGQVPTSGIDRPACG